MAKTITLKFPAKCADKACGKELAAGSLARWYGRGRIYGIGCHAAPGAAASESSEPGATFDGLPAGAPAPRRERTAYERGDRSRGALRSHYDRRGVYSIDGSFLGTSGPKCEDAPCCGCCS